MAAEGDLKETLGVEGFSVDPREPNTKNTIRILENKIWNICYKFECE